MVGVGGWALGLGVRLAGWRGSGEVSARRQVDNRLDVVFVHLAGGWRAGWS